MLVLVVLSKRAMENTWEVSLPILVSTHFFYEKLIVIILSIKIMICDYRVCA